LWDRGGTIYTPIGVGMQVKYCNPAPVFAATSKV
jgi:hypothetical protein